MKCDTIAIGTIHDSRCGIAATARTHRTPHTHTHINRRHTRMGRWIVCLCMWIKMTEYISYLSVYSPAREQVSKR